MRKLLSALVLLVAVSSVYAEKGEFSYIPKVKVGASKIDLDQGGYSYTETEPTYGAGIDILYGFTENFEAGVGASIEKNYITKTLGDSTGGSDSITLGQLFVTGRYNFRNSSEFTPFIQAKAGVVRGDETYSASGRVRGYSVEGSLDVDPTVVYGISTGVEYKSFNVELGVEVVKVDLELDAHDNKGHKLNKTEEEDIKTIYMALGYRF